MKHHIRTNGYTLIEIMIVLAVIGILFVMVVLALQTFANKPEGDASARVALGTLEEAHARTLSGKNDMQYGVHFDTSGVTMFEGSSYTAGDPGNDVRSFQRAEITNISLSGGGSDVVFSRLRGEASATGTVTVTQTNDVTQVRTITIYGTGLSQVNE